ncbi:hypothetical protein HGRIS_009335 [Hohenbuehelia grisea]|uniref:PPM-type phosphatase domain-containing protein n=1 Tax=Hohenbuehelia grisea TaxID=104357 RepID=A0ABR3J109_9AGAR
MSLFRPAWKPIAASLALGASGAALYTYTRRQETFDITVKTKGEDGKRVASTKTLPLHPMSDLDARIRQNATAESRARPGITWKHTTASLASNDPIEDANANAIVHRDADDPAAPGDLLFFAVMDGHSGYNTSQLLSRVLINAVALELSVLDVKPPQPSGGVLNGLKSSLWPSKPTPDVTRDKLQSADPQTVSAAIENAFVKLDKELIEAPLRVLANNLDSDSWKSKTVPDLSQHPLALQTMLPAVSGACALMAVFDTAHQNLYVSCTGDSRAVAGVWEPSTSGEGGAWRVEVLSEDQTGRNPNEIKRVRSEHPSEEAPYVIREGRILGGLEPSRAFGDARYKWPREVQAALSEAFLAGNGRSMRPPPSSFKTPPYVTARPVVTHHKLSLPTPESPSSSATPSLRFLVLATDGLWDELSSEDVVRLVGGHLAGLKGSISRSDLQARIPTTSGTPTVDGKSASTQERRAQDSTGAFWAFKDDNVSAHLIRNAFGGADEPRLRKLLSIPAPYSRRYRDDITVTVVWWEEGQEGAAQVEKLKAKL